MKNAIRLSAATCALALLPLAAGCSGPANSTSQSSAAQPSPTAAGAGRGPVAVPVSGLAKGMVLPLEAYEETYPESEELLRARLSLEGQCMREYGFSFAPTLDTGSAPLNYDASNMARRYGITDLASAESSGYYVALDSSAGAQTQPALSKAEMLVLVGSADPGAPSTSATAGSYDGKAIPAGGCVGQAERRIGAVPSALLADQLDIQSLTASQGSPTVVAAIGQWSACMKQHGFAVAGPYDASQLSAQLGSSPGSALDRTIAVDDVDCKQSTNLVRIWFTVDTRLQDQYIDANQLTLRQQQAQLDSAVKNATAILAQ